MRVGELKNRLEFQSPVRVSDGMGGHTTTWLAEFTVWGSYWPLSGDEAVAAMQSGGMMTGRVRIRYRGDAIKTSWRIKFGDVYLDIASPPINLGGTNRFLEIKVREAA